MVTPKCSSIQIHVVCHLFDSKLISLSLCILLIFEIFINSKNPHNVSSYTNNQLIMHVSSLSNFKLIQFNFNLLQFQFYNPIAQYRMQEYLEMTKSRFHKYREKYQPRVPAILQETFLKEVSQSAPVLPEIAEIFPMLMQRGIKSVSFDKVSESQGKQIVNPLRIGCVLSGGQAAGGHNVIVGIYETIKKKHPNSQLFGFLNGPHGIYSGKYIQITDSHISYFKNRGGFDMICSGRHKIQSPEQFQKSLKYCESLKLDGLVVIGGDDSNTNAALLAEYFLSKNSSVKVVGCPKTIDGDLKNQFVEVSFGFDTACKTYAECIGSVMDDTMSSKKYYHFIRLMGRSASHIALECALLTRPTYTFIGQQIQANKATLKGLVNDLVKIIVDRAINDKNFGVILVPEGLIEFIGEVNILIKQINNILAKLDITHKDATEIFNLVLEQLSSDSSALLKFLPTAIAEQLLLDRDPHGNVQVAKIETQKLIIQLVRNQLENIKDFKGSFKPLSNYFGYEGRCPFPTNFDCDYCYSLGSNAAAIIQTGYTGMMSCIRGLDKQPEHWLAGGYPLLTMMSIQTRKGKNVPVITKALVDLNGPLFKLFSEERGKWAMDQYFNSVGPIQFQFPCVTPYLAVPVTKQGLYLSHQKTYKEKPYLPLYGKNMNPLSYNLRTRVPKNPYILNGNHELVYSQKLAFKNNEVGVEISQRFQLLAKLSNRYIQFKESSKQNQRRKIRIGVCFNGRQTPGGHNIISGLLDEHVTVIGFLNGTKGLFKGSHIVVNKEDFDFYRNQSGFHFLGRSADKIRSEEELKQTKETCIKLDLDGLILVGATHTLNDALKLSEYFLLQDCKTKVVGLPASIDNTVYHSQLEVSVGFSSSSQLYSTLTANLMTDASSNTKYWYFIRIMGRDPSNLALECALSTHPNLVFISEQVQGNAWDIQQVVDEAVRVVLEREKKGLNFGCVLIPEGLINVLPSIKRITKELQQIKSDDKNVILEKLSPWSKHKYLFLPEFIQRQLILKDEGVEAMALSQIETEKMIAYLVEQKLKQLKKQGKYKGSFSSVCHFFGYQGRCAYPNQFDQDLATSYAKVSRILIENNLTGYCPTVKGVTSGVQSWIPGAIPLVQMWVLKPYSPNRMGIPIRKVHFRNKAFKQYLRHKQSWILVDHYQNPGPIQFFGEMKNYVPLSLTLSNQNTSRLIEDIEANIKQIRSICRFGTDDRQLQIAKIALDSIIQTLLIYNEN